MKLANYILEILHKIRKKDIEILFGDCPEYKYEVGIEIGSGDGYPE
jgi:hypothetical protein